MMRGSVHMPRRWAGNAQDVEVAFHGFPEFVLRVAPHAAMLAPPVRVPVRA